MSPGHKRQIAGIFVNRGLCSERAAWRHVGLHRSTFQYEAKQPNAWLARLKIALKRMSRLHPELGYAKITRLLKDEGWQVGNRMVQRLRRECWAWLSQPGSPAGGVRASLLAYRSRLGYIRTPTTSDRRVWSP